MYPWKLVTTQNGISVYENEETWEIDVVDCYEPE